MEKLIKRKRASNWVEEDKILLKELIKERVSEIENKNTDTNTNQRKKKAWLDLEESFNNLSKGGKRNASQLKSQWTLTKIQAKKDISSHRREVAKTGGGPQPQQKEISADDIYAWLPNEFVIDTNDFDSDVVVSEISQNQEKVSPIKMEVTYTDVEELIMENEQEEAFVAEEFLPEPEEKIIQAKTLKKKKIMLENAHNFFYIKGFTFIASGIDSESRVFQSNLLLIYSISNIYNCAVCY